MLRPRDDSSIHYKYNGRHHPATGDLMADTRLAARGPEIAAEAGAVTAPMLVLVGQHEGGLSEARRLSGRAFPRSTPTRK